MNFYLIKRGHFEDKINWNEIDGIDYVMNWDYMGSSEFEWGAPRGSLVRIMKLYYQHNFTSTKIIINNKEFIIWFPYSWTEQKTNNIQEIINFFTASIKNPYHGRLKEMLNFDKYWEGHYKTVVKGRGKAKAIQDVNYGYCDFWWDIDHDWFLYPNENNNDKVMNYVFKALERRNWGKD